jgi:serine protease inhibitor
MKKVVSKFAKILLVTSVVLAGCRNVSSSEPTSFTQKSFAPLSDKDLKVTTDSKIVTANNKFGINLYSELVKNEKDKNIFISPLSISFALSMTYNGAGGETKKAMEKALSFDDMTLDEVNKESNALIRHLIYSDTSVRLDIANSLWGKKGTEFNSEFIKNNESFYKAEVRSLDFKSAESPKIINDWVSLNTNKKIEKIVDKIPPEALLYLINAIYFKGTWTDKFDKELTKEQDFKLPDGKTKKVQMMSRYDDFKYAKSDKFEVVSLPYGKELMSMYVFLPTENLEDFYKELTSDNWKNWMKELKKTKGEVGLPRFKNEYEKTINDVLKTLGMTEAFSDKADFKKIFAKDTAAAITEVRHKSFIEVNEEGTEAAAVTSVQVGATSFMPVSKPFKMIMDKPFFYVLRDNQSGTILFMGAVNQP